MPEIIGLIHNAKSLDELESKLKELKFEAISRDELDPPIRRVCERAASDESNVEKLQFGIVIDEKDHKEYCGVSRGDLRIYIVHRDFVKKRRDRYQAFPLPNDPEKRSSFVQELIFEVLEKSSSTNPESMGSSYAHIYYHVADFVNLEVDQARALVDEELPKMDYLEKSVGDHWRIKPHLVATIRTEKLDVGEEQD